MFYLFDYDEPNEPLETIVTDTPEAILWAETQYRPCRQRVEDVAEPISEA